MCASCAQGGHASTHQHTRHTHCYHITPTSTTSSSSRMWPDTLLPHNTRLIIDKLSQQVVAGTPTSSSASSPSRIWPDATLPHNTHLIIDKLAQQDVAGCDVNSAHAQARQADRMSACLLLLRVGAACGRLRLKHCGETRGGKGRHGASVGACVQPLPHARQGRPACPPLACFVAFPLGKHFCVTRPLFGQPTQPLLPLACCTRCVRATNLPAWPVHAAHPHEANAGPAHPWSNG